jgi:hypothetical protein
MQKYVCLLVLRYKIAYDYFCTFSPTRHQLVAELDPRNAGVLIVRLDGQGKGMDPDEVTRRLERGNQDCVIM